MDPLHRSDQASHFGVANPAADAFTLAHDADAMAANHLVNRYIVDPGVLVPLDEAKRNFEQDYLVRLLRTTGGNISRAARLAGRNRTDLYRILRRHGLSPAQFKPAP